MNFSMVNVEEIRDGKVRGSWLQDCSGVELPEAINRARATSVANSGMAIAVFPQLPYMARHAIDAVPLFVTSEHVGCPKYVQIEPGLLLALVELCGTQAEAMANRAVDLANDPRFEAAHKAMKDAVWATNKARALLGLWVLPF